MKKQPPPESSDILLALQELRGMGLVSESEYAADATSIDTCPAPEETPERRPGTRMRVSFFRRVLLGE